MKDIKLNTIDIVKNKYQDVKTNVRNNVADRAGSLSQTLSKHAPNTYPNSSLSRTLEKIAGSKVQDIREDAKKRLERTQDAAAQEQQTEALDGMDKSLTAQLKLVNKNLEKIDKTIRVTGSDGGLLGKYLEYRGLKGTLKGKGTWYNPKTWFNKGAGSTTEAAAEAAEATGATAAETTEATAAAADTTAVAASTGSRVLSGATKVIGRVALPLTGLIAGYSEYNSADNKDQSTEVKTARAVTTGAGTMAGALGGAKLGAMGGAALGSVIPGLGTTVGGIVGAIVGGIGGAFGGEKFSKWISRKVFKSDETKQKDVDTKKELTDNFDTRNALIINKAEDITNKSTALTGNEEGDEEGEGPTYLEKQDAKNLKDLTTITKEAYRPRGLMERLFSTLSAPFEWLRSKLGGGPSTPTGGAPIGAPSSSDAEVPMASSHGTPSSSSSYGTPSSSSYDTPSSSGSTTSSTSGSIDTSNIVAEGFAGAALSGIPYNNKRDGTGMDCSEISQAAYRAAGISIPGTAEAQRKDVLKNGTPVTSIKDLQPGDLIFYHSEKEEALRKAGIAGGGARKPVGPFGATHVAVYLGKDPVTGKPKMFESGNSKTGAKSGVKDFRAKGFIMGGRPTKSGDSGKRVMAALVGNQGGSIPKDDIQVASSDKAEPETTQSTSTQKASSEDFKTVTSPEEDIKKEEPYDVASVALPSDIDSEPQGLVKQLLKSDNFVAASSPAVKKEEPLLDTVSAVEAASNIPASSGTNLPISSTEGLKPETTTNNSGLLGFLNKVLSTVTGAATSGYSDLKDSGGKLYDKISNGISDTVGAGLDTLKNKAQSATDTVMGSWDNLASSAFPVIDGATGAVNRAFSGVPDAQTVKSPESIVLPPRAELTSNKPTTNKDNKVSQQPSYPPTANLPAAEVPSLRTDGMFMVEDGGLNLIILGVV
jgi:cell wall-associated NlpC family hydrolase